MIAGELESAFGYGNYYNFLGSKKRKKRREQRRQKEQEEQKPLEKRQEEKGNKEIERKPVNKLIEKGREFLKQSGGVEGIKQTASNVKSYIKDDSPSDFEVNVGEGDEGDKDKKDDKGKESLISGVPDIVVYVGAGVVLILVAVAAYNSMQSAKPAPTIIQAQ